MEFKLLRRFAPFAPIAFFVFFLTLSACTSEDDVKPEQHDITIGAILSLEGQWSTLGINSAAALEIAVEEINSYFNSVGYNGRVSVEIYDSELDPEKALSHLESAAANGIEVIIGPQSSAELSALKSFADQNNVLVISNASTAGSLSLPGDNVFRFCPDGTLEGEALAKQIYDDGIRGLVTASRDDLGNRGLEIDLVKAFEELGGTVYSIEPYGIDTEDFGAIIGTIEDRILEAGNEFGPEQTGVYLAAFDEGVTLMEQAADDPTLSSVKWYGGDGLVSSEALVNSPAAADFAIATEFIAPNFTLPENARSTWGPLSDQIEAETGLSVSAFALAAYDALWVTALTRQSSADSQMDFTKFKELFTQKAKSHFGATGPTQLNQNGDRSIAAFGFWGVEKVNDSYQWVLVGSSE